MSRTVMTDEELLVNSREWWDANPMTYDWHKSIRPSEGTKEFYETIDERFFASSSFYRGTRPFERLIPFERLRGKRVLEIGCGIGSHARLLAQSGCHLTCIDLTSRAIENTRRRLQLWGLQADLRQMNAEELDFPDNYFDFVWSWGVIHHSPNTEQIARNVRRVLKPEGEFRLMVYHRRSLSGLYCLGRGLLSGKFSRGMSVEDVLSHYTDGFLAHFYTRSEFSDLLKRSGFAHTEMSVLGQKSELIPLPGKGAAGHLKQALLRALPDPIAEILLSQVGYFLFAIANNQGAN
jgi:2-polyprenyl-3-methyl-5-hydroxy-6-metoxy-1,4-benzoquinol methylase